MQTNRCIYIVVVIVEIEVIVDVEVHVVVVMDVVDFDGVWWLLLLWMLLLNHATIEK